MKLRELEEVLAQEFRPDTYSLAGGTPNDTFCLEERLDSWAFYYSERGLRLNERTFRFEDDACAYMLEYMEQRPRLRKLTNT